VTESSAESGGLFPRGRQIAVSWWNNWEDAAKRPKRTVVYSSLTGLAVGGLFGYFRFGHSAVWTALIAVSVGAIFARGSWTNMHDPTLLRPQDEDARRETKRRLKRRALRIGLLFAVIPFALIVALLAGSANAFVIAFITGIAVQLVLGRMLLR
jgi:hypothetical protein